MEEIQDIQVISSTESLGAIVSSEIDAQIATAKKYPRNLGKALDKMISYAAHDQETAASCFYSIPRDGKMIQGYSVRLAEIVAATYGNIRVASRVIANDGKTITAQAVCQDLEENTASCVEVRVGILKKNGTRYSEDMQVTIGNAACSKAYRNAVFRVVPFPVIKRAIDQIRKVAMGSAADIESLRSRCLGFYKQRGVTDKQILEFMQRSSKEELTQEDIFTLAGIATAIEEGDTTIDEAIIGVLNQRKAEKEAEKKQTATQAKVAEAMKKNIENNK